MSELTTAIDQQAEQSGFSGVVRVDLGSDVLHAQAYGMADRAHGIANTVDTQFALASGAKGLTALGIVSLIEEGALSLDTTARSLLADDLPLIDDQVTIEHLLAHRSGIGDYIDEDEGGDIGDYVMPIPVHRLATTEDFVQVLDGFPQKFAPGTKFSYCNSGFVVLALLAERASGVPYHDLVDQRVLQPAGMSDTAFLRSDELPGRAAIGYLSVDGVTRTNLLHLPVRGTGDGGVYSTVADMRLFWQALFGGRIVSTEWVTEMTRPRSDAPEDGRRYGLGFWLHQTGDPVVLVGYDAGVSFSTSYDPTTDVTFTVIANDSEATWPMARLIATLV